MAKVKTAERMLETIPNLGLEIPYELAGLPQGAEVVIRCLIPGSAIKRDGKDFRALSVKRLFSPAPEDKKSPRNLARNLIWNAKTSGDYFLNSLGSGLEEFELKWRIIDKRAIRVILSNHFGLKSFVEVGYRSTRLDLANQPITKPRAYLGKIVGMDDETVLMETCLGLRRLRLDSIAWAAASPGDSCQILAVDFVFKGIHGKQYVDYSWLGEDQINADEPRDLLLAEEETVNPYDDGGLTRIPVDRTSVLLLAPFLDKKVYIEHFNERGNLVLATVAKIEGLDWNENRYYTEQRIHLKFKLSRGKELAFSNGGFIRIGLLKTITKKTKMKSKEGTE